MDEITNRIKENFPILDDPKLLEELKTHGRLVEVSEGEEIMQIGSYIRLMPLVTKGAIKVLREDDDGSDLFLYFLYPGQSCAMTVHCCMAHAPSEVHAVAEHDTEFIAIPIHLVDEWIRKHHAWRTFILQTYSNRFTELLHTLDSVVFQKLDERLLQYLSEKAQLGGGNTVNSTHQDIADDLHSSREVISRLLKQMEKQGNIKLGRNKIELM